MSGLNVFDLYGKIGLNTDDFENGVNNCLSFAQGSFSKVGEMIKDIGSKFMDFAKDSIQTGMSFDSTMSQVAATMGKSVDEIQDLRDFAKETGKTTQFTATQAAEALNYMALAGYDSEKSMRMLPQVLNLAAAGCMDLATASDMVTDTQTAFGLSIEETESLINKMAKTASSTNTSVSQLGDAMLTIGATARNIKGGTTEISAVLGALADNGKKGAEAGTALRNIVMALSSPKDKAVPILEQLGITTLDDDGNLRSIIDIMQELQQATANMGTGERSDILGDIFNKYDLAAVEALMGTTSDRWDEIIGKIETAGNAAEQMANTQTDNLQGSLNQMKSAAESIKLTFSDAVSPSLKGGVDLITTSLKILSSGLESGNADTFANSLSYVIRKWIKKAISNMEQGADTIDTIAKSIGAVFNKAIIPMLPHLLTAAGTLISALGGALIDNLPMLIDAAISIVTMLSTYFAENAPTMIPKIVELVLSIAEMLTRPDVLGALIGGAIALITGLANGLIDSLPILIERIPKIVENIVTSIVENAPKLISAALELIYKLSDFLTDPENLVKILDAGVNILSTLISGILSVIAEIGKAADDIVKRFMEAIGLGDFYEKGKKIIAKIVQGIKDGYEELGVVQFFEHFGEKVYDKLHPEEIETDDTDIPKLAKGGILTKPTKLIAGEQGAEIVLPLENNTGWMRKLARNIVSESRATGTAATGTAPIINISLDGAIFTDDYTMDKFTELLSERLGALSIQQSRAIGAT